MRLTRFIPVAVMATLAAMSCNPVEEIKPATEVTGTYSGWSKAEFQYSPTPMVSNTQTLTVTAEEGGETVAVSYTSDTWGTFTVTGAAVTGTDGTYTVTGSGKTVMGMSADSQSEYDCTLSATIKSADDFTFTFDIPSGTYTGTLNMSVMGSAMDPVENATMVLDVADDGKTVLTISSFGMGMMTLEDVTVDVTLTESADGSYALAAESIDTMAGDINVTGSLTGTVTADGSKLTVSADIKPGAMPMTINVEFEGSK